MKHSFLSMLFLLACTDSRTGSTTIEIPIQKEVQQTELVKSFNNPALIYGTDFITFVSTLQVTGVCNTTLLNYTSTISKARYSKQDIAEYYKMTNLNFKKKLKAIRKLNDTTYLLNYEGLEYGTREIKTYTVTVEQDTCRLLIEK
jgi:hypothetical protein